MSITRDQIVDLFDEHSVDIYDRFCKQQYIDIPLATHSKGFMDVSKLLVIYSEITSIRTTPSVFGSSPFRSGLTNINGKEYIYKTPKCLVNW